MDLALAVDIGGTKILAGAVTDDGEILATARRSTPRGDAVAVLDLVAEVVAELVAGGTATIDGVGVGVAGLVDAERSTVYFAPNLRWSQVPARALLEARTGLPVVIENDGNIAAWGEYRFGAGRGAGDLTLITVGTGIGGGIVVNGGLFRGSHGAAGEIGHINAVPDGRPCGCGRNGCLEQYASGNALVSCFGASNTGTQILKVTPSGTFTVIASGLKSPRQMVFDASGNILVTNLTGNSISRISPAGVGRRRFVRAGSTGPFASEGPVLGTGRKPNGTVVQDPPRGLCYAADSAFCPHPRCPS